MLMTLKWETQAKKGRLCLEGKATRSQAEIQDQILSLFGILTEEMLKQVNQNVCDLAPKVFRATNLILERNGDTSSQLGAAHGLKLS